MNKPANVMMAPPKASAIVIIITRLPTCFKDDSLNEQPIVKAMKPNAISLIYETAPIDVCEFGSIVQPPIYCPKTYGPKTMPAIK